MLVEAALFLVGLVALVAGADRTINAAGDLGLYYGLSPFFVGVTVISVGTSVPEMVTSVYAAYYGAGTLVVGNIVGSETAQITLAIAIVGGQVLVTNGVAIAELLGVPESFVGLLTGLGTTVPEIVVAGIAAYEGESGISVGSLLGSNVTDPVFSRRLRPAPRPRPARRPARSPAPA